MDGVQPEKGNETLYVIREIFQRYHSGRSKPEKRFRRGIEEAHRADHRTGFSDHRHRDGRATVHPDGHGVRRMTGLRSWNEYIPAANRTCLSTMHSS